MIGACLITNSHYTDIYPYPIIANGGLLGDVIFFAVSGYCLYNIKDNFLIWYGKRLAKVYPPVIVITIIYVLVGYYDLNVLPFNWWFLYPTNYHFVASIIVLYIPYYFIVKNKVTRDNIGIVMFAVFIICILYYVLFYDKTYYHIDTVREPFIRFLYFECMLLGVRFRQKDLLYRNKFQLSSIFFGGLFFVLYFGTKVYFAANVQYSEFQIINQITIFCLLFFVLKIFSSLDEKLEKMPNRFVRIIQLVSDITLEIYVVQGFIIDKTQTVALFPINWIICTFSIVVAACLLHFVCEIFEKKISEGIKTKRI